MGHADLEFAWGELRPGDPAEQAKILDIYVRDGIYAVNEARNLLGLDPVPGGDQPMVYGTAGAVPLSASGAMSERLQRRASGEATLSCGCPGAAAHVVPGSVRKYNPDEPRVPAGNPHGGWWTADATDGGTQVAAPGGVPCDGFSAGCQSGGSYGSSALYHILGRNLCTDCATKFLGLENEPATTKVRELGKYIIEPE